MLKREDIIEKTNQGLDVILDYVPEADKGVKNYAYKFRCDTLKDEKNPSLGLQMNEAGTEWVIRDWAGSGTWSCFDVVMAFERLDFSAALRYIAERYNLSDGKKKARSYEYERLDAAPDAKLKEQQWEYREGYNISELKRIFPKHVWEYLGKGAPKGEKEEQAYQKAAAVCEKYGFFEITWKSIVHNDKTTGKKVRSIFKATDNYPMYVFHILDHKKTDKAPEPIAYKFYEPYGSQRFSYYGEIPKDYIFGMSQVKEAFESLERDSDILEKLGLNPKDQDEKKIAEFLTESFEELNAPKKLPEVLIATGGSDALCMAALGYLPIWFNGEHINPADVPFSKLSGMAYKVINIPDIDLPGQTAAAKLANFQIEIFTATLPAELAEKWSGKYNDDNSKKYCKDVRDFFNYWRPYDFKHVLAHARPLKFWTKRPRMNGKIVMRENGNTVYKYTPKATYILHFLNHAGFAVMERQTLSGKVREYIKLNGNRVQKLTDTTEMKTAVDNFVQKHSFDVELSDSMLRSRDVADAIFSRLPAVELDFKDCDKDYQYFFLANETWKITADNIEVFEPATVQKFVWEHEVIKPNYVDERSRERKDVKFSKLPENFCISVSTPPPPSANGEVDQSEYKNYDISIPNGDCMFLKYLINTSRIHWRIELEKRLDKLDFSDLSQKLPNGQTLAEIGCKNKTDYREKYRFAIDGPLLDEEQVQQQKMHLITKLLSIGKMMFRYKSMSSAKAVWSMDYTMRDLSKSSGGTGKSLTPYCLSTVLPNERISGRDKTALANKHVFENISEDTDMLWMDDADQSTDLSFFYSAITGFMKKNPKGTKSETIDFEESPQIWITSNYPPLDMDQDSTIRRLWITEYCDYYHYNQSKQYRSVWQPVNDLGKELIRDFNEADWNRFLNTLAVCCKSYIKLGYVESRDSNMRYNAYRNKIGATFIEWADVYFNAEDQTLDNFIHRGKIFADFLSDTTSDMKANGFGSRMRDYAAMKGYLFNPPEINRYLGLDGRVSCKQTHDWAYSSREKRCVPIELSTPKQMEFFYLQTDVNKPINYDQIEMYNPAKKTDMVPQYKKHADDPF